MPLSGVPSPDDDISDILAELPEVQFPQSQYPYLSHQLQANRPAYTYSFRLHPNGLKENIPPYDFKTYLTAHTVRVHCCIDLFIPYANYITGSITYNKESQKISFHRLNGPRIRNHLHIYPYPKLIAISTTLKDT